ncbi:ABC transporter permease [Mesorhizobium australicum]|uniref:Peptide/nickel transport system permease protein n=1 Tax=Mesorhizobium australicum TaxID=536018 RepID=A0A1X7PQC4_9HYPH|nr:ABC transporter permease [Mesorhizobium australicum]SMH54009.1 peptide/nickel transport system permease protein [Mesorhizobium australicum]
MLSIADIRFILRRNLAGAVAAVLIVVLMIVAIIGPYIAPYDPLSTNLREVLQPPSATFWFGTDHLGRDIFSRVIVAARLDFAIAIVAVSLSAVVGSAVGALSGYVGGWLDRILGRVVDVMMAFPLFVAAMALVAVLGNSVESIVLATAIINLPFYFRLMRAEISARRETGYVEAAIINGNSTTQVIFGFLVPNSLPPVIVQISLNLGWAILNTAGLAFIGLGVAPPTPEWGIMIQEGASMMVSGQWWVVVFPGLALAMSVFCFSLLGDAIRDVMDPRRRS